MHTFAVKMQNTLVKVEDHDSRNNFKYLDESVTVFLIQLIQHSNIFFKSKRLLLIDDFGVSFVICQNFLTLFIFIFS